MPVTSTSKGLPQSSQKNVVICLSFLRRNSNRHPIDQQQHRLNLPDDNIHVNEIHLEQPNSLTSACNPYIWQGLQHRWQAEDPQSVPQNMGQLRSVLTQSVFHAFLSPSIMFAPQLGQ